MSINDESIVYEIKLSAEVQKEVDDTEAKIAEIKKIISDVEKDINEVKGTETKSETKKDSSTLTDGEEFIKTIDSEGLGNLQSLATNPGSLLSSQFLSFLTKGGPQTAIIATLITSVVSSPESIAQIIKALAAPGGPLNRDWQRFIKTQVDIGLSTAQLERRQTGADILVTPQKRGFIPSNEAWAQSSIISIDAKKVARIGLTDKEEGLYE